MLDQIIKRITRLISFDLSVYPEIEQDVKATQEAAIIVVVASLLASLSVIGWSFGRFLVQFLIVQIGLGWLLWSLITQLVGTKLFGGQSTFMGLARTLGYARAPMVLGILAFIPGLGWLISLAAGILSLVLGFFAVRETLKLSTGQAIITVAIGWVVMLIVGLVI